MRQVCKVDMDGGITCGKPAVDFIEMKNNRFYFCTEHYDIFRKVYPEWAALTDSRVKP
jgi:hypothetical protein